MKLSHIDNNTKIAVINALANIGDKQAIQPLADAMRRESLDTFEAIKVALAKQGGLVLSTSQYPQGALRGYYANLHE